MAAGRQWVNEISEKGLEIDCIYAIKKKDPPRKGKKAGYFFSIVVSDATGEIKVNFWGKGEEASVRSTYEALREGSMVRVRGRSDLFGDSVVVQVNQGNGDILEEAKEGTYDLAEFIVTSKKDPEVMFQELLDLLSQIRDKNISRMLELMFSDPALVTAFKRSPASVSYHCAWVGGLLEHTLKVARACDFISQLYEELDRDLLLASAVLHDIGKVRCYNVSTAITESVDGRLRGHIVIGAQMVEDTCSRCPDFPETLRTKLVHMVLASHGAYEKGSPTLPSIPEALALTFADEMDAKLERFIRARDNGGREDLFVVDHMLGTKVFLG
jgi:3'-5' exoribonuclease